MLPVIVALTLVAILAALLWRIQRKHEAFIRRLTNGEDTISGTDPDPHADTHSNADAGLDTAGR